MHTNHFTRLLAAVTLMGAAASAAAQAKDERPADPSAALGGEALGSKVVPAAPGPGLPPGPLTEVGNKLRDNGVSLGATLFNLNYHNPSTGIQQGQSGNYGMLFLSAGFDLGKIAGLSDTEVNVTEVWNRPAHNSDTYLFQTGSAFTPFPVVTTAWDLANLTVSHRMMDRRLKLEFGRMNLNTEFMVGNMCRGCILSAPATVLNEPGISKSVWGAKARYDLDPDSTVGLGVIEDNPDAWQKSNGSDWSRGRSIGYIAVANYTQRKGFGDTRHPHRLEGGLFYASAAYDDPLLNADGSSHVQNPTGQAMKHRGKWGGYFQGRKVYWSGQGGAFGTPENLAGYGGVVLSPGRGVRYSTEAYIGTEWSGFMPANPLAMIGTTARYIRMTSRQALFEQQVRAGFTEALNAMSGGAVPVVDEALPRNMFLFDVHGRIGVVPGVFVESYVQYLRNPNAIIPATTSRISNGYMFGINLLVDFGVLSGLSRMPGDKIF